MPAPEPASVPVFILCGGFGSRLGEVGATRPKPMLDIGEKPMLVHIMSWYSRFGFRRFILCTGHLFEVISHYFLNYKAMNSDYTIELATDTVSFHQSERLPDWSVTVAFTGINTMTGARLARAAARYLGEGEHFGLTYGDGLTNANLGDELAFHLAHDRLGTVLGVQPSSQFGHLALHEDGAAGFVEKPPRRGDMISGGYFFFRRAFLDYLSADEGCILEGEPLQRLSAAGQLRAYQHEGFWSCVDTVRDRDRVKALWETGSAPWRWQGG